MIKAKDDNINEKKRRKIEINIYINEWQRLKNKKKEKDEINIKDWKMKEKK